MNVASLSHPSSHPTPDISEISSSPSVSESSAKALNRLRSSLEQSFRSAIRSKRILPTGTDEFTTITFRNVIGKDTDRSRTGESPQKDKEKSKMLQKLESKVTFRRAARESPAPSSFKPAPISKDPIDQVRAAGFAPFVAPSIRQGSMSSPALQFPSPPSSPSKSRPPIPSTSGSPRVAATAPSRDQTRPSSLQPKISPPTPLATRGNPGASTSRHRSTKSTPVIPTAVNDGEQIDEPRTPTDRGRDFHGTQSPATPISRSGSQLGRSSSRKASASSGHLPLRSPSTSPVPPSPPSPSRPRAARVVSPSRGGLSSPSASHLPLDLSAASVVTERRSVDSPRKASTDAPRRISVDTTRRVSVETPRSPSSASHNESPLPSPRLRPTSPNQRAYAQNRHFNMSTTSLTGPPNPEYRELIRKATSMLCKEVVKIPPHMSRTRSGVNDWEEVELRTQALARLDRVRGSSGVVNASGGSGFTGSAEEKERRLFAEALRDGFVLCQLMNKLRAASVLRPDPREEKIVRTSNITKFLAACCSCGLPNEDLFQLDDLIEGTGESLARVARTIIALIKFLEAPPVERSKYITGQGKKVDPSAISSPYSLGASLSRASSSTPNLPRRRTSPSVAPARKRYNPPPALPPVLSGSQEGSPSVEDENRVEIEVGDLNNGRVPDIMPPPRSPLRARPVKRSDERDSPSIQLQASPLSSRPSAGGASIADSFNHRQSVLSSTMTETTVMTDISSILDFGRSRTNSSGHNKFGTIRTVTTDATSAAPSMTRTEGSAVADELARLKNIESGGKHFKDRKVSDASDLMRVVEELDDGASSSRSEARDKGKARKADEKTVMNRPERITAVHLHLQKGKWPEDFLDALQSHSQSSQAITPDSPTRGEDWSTSPSISFSSPRKLAIVGLERNDGLEGLRQSPRRPTHRARRSLDSPGLLPKESPQSRDSSPSGLSSSPGRVMLRRNSTKSNMVNKNTVYVSSRTDPEKPLKSTGDPLVPFPQTSSGDRSSPPTGDDDPLGVPEKPRVPRGRFSSDVDSSSARRRDRPNLDDVGGGGPKLRRARIESMMNLGADSRNASASDLLSSPRDSVDGSAVRRTLIIREDGKAPVHFQLGNCIGRGQFGSVYRALNLNTGQMVAVKRIRLEGLKEDEVMTLMGEVDLVKSLSHPSIVKYEGMARDDDTLSLVLEYAENGSLGQTLKAFGKLNERLVASYVIKILEGLHYLHSSDVVHCDLKAANILTTKNGNVKLSDFGVSLNLRAMKQEMKDVAGTPNWMAPEVIELKGASTKSDIWSLACTIIELLTGRPPYADITNSMSVMFRIVEDRMPPIPDGCSLHLEDFLKQCFQKKPSMRPSAELLCEHPWLKQNWGVHKELRPQDSIPFLRRISADLQKSEVAKYFPPEIDLPILTLNEGIPSSPPRHRISDISAQFLADNGLSPREHSFVKTTFSKPMVCRVCLLNVKKSAVLCAQCSLIAHGKCIVNAPPTCDLRAQYLSYAKYAEKGNLSSAYPNLEGIRNGHPPSASSDVSYTTSIVVPPPPQSQSNPPNPSAGHKFLAALAFKRSRANLSQGSIQPVAPVPSRPGLKEAEVTARIKPTAAFQDRPQSLSSEGSGISSLGSAATAAESFSSRRDATSIASFLEVDQPQDEENDLSYGGGAFPGSLAVATNNRPRKRDPKYPGCVMQ